MVVGAGPWGLMTGWRGAQAGARVTVIGAPGEPSAASVAAGMLGPWAEASEGEEEMHALMVRALGRWPAGAVELTRETGLDPGYRESGAVLVAARPEHIGVVRRRAETIRLWGGDAPWLGVGALRAVEPRLDPDVAGGLDLPAEHQVEPRALLHAPRVACAAHGVRLVDGEAVALEGEGRVRGVRLADGSRLTGDRVVLAAGHTAGRLSDRVAVRAVKGQMLRLSGGTGPLPIHRTVRTPGVYLAPRDGEVVVGATMEERGDRRVTAAAVRDLLDEAVRAVPEIGELELVEPSAGLRPATVDGRPVIGADPDGSLVRAVGGYRHGVLLAPLAAEVAAAAALGEAGPHWADALAPSRRVACT